MVEGIPSLEDRRRKVSELLQRCVDEKLLYGGTSNAIALAQEAYEIATVDNVPSPWPEFAAYRLAHLKMRSNPISVDTLRGIDSLFAQASRFEKAGPIPLIYRLAVLHRLVEALIDKKEISQVKTQSEEVFRKALGLLRCMPYVPESPQGDRIERQSVAFNMLEFATYMTGRAYKSLEGVSLLSPLDPFREGDWFVVGRDIDRIGMTEVMARWEFEQRAGKNPELVLIQLIKDKKAKICLSGDLQWSPFNLVQAKLVLTLLRSPNISRVDLEQKVVGTVGAEAQDRFRQAKSRLQKKFRELTGNAAFEVFDGEHLRNDVPILGLVHGPSLR